MRTLVSVVVSLAVVLPAAIPAHAIGTMAEWRIVAFRLVKCNVQYPRARDVPAGGAVALVKFDVGEEGSITSISLARGSGIAVFDEAALIAVKLSSPLPRPPVQGNPAVSVQVPIRFMPPPVPFLGSPIARSPCRLRYRG